MILRARRIGLQKVHLDCRLRPRRGEEHLHGIGRLPVKRDRDALDTVGDIPVSHRQNRISVRVEECDRHRTRAVRRLVLHRAAVRAADKSVGLPDAVSAKRGAETAVVLQVNRDGARRRPAVCKGDLQHDDVLPKVGGKVGNAGVGVRQRLHHRARQPFDQQRRIVGFVARRRTVGHGEVLRKVVCGAPSCQVRKADLPVFAGKANRVDAASLQVEHERIAVQRAVIANRSRGKRRACGRNLRIRPGGIGGDGHTGKRRKHARRKEHRRKDKAGGCRTPPHPRGAACLPVGQRLRHISFVHFAHRVGKLFYLHTYPSLSAR